MITVLVEPYWVNAAEWWLKYRNDNQTQFNVWLSKQGVLVKYRKEYTPYIEFSSEVQAKVFQAKWRT